MRSIMVAMIAVFIFSACEDESAGGKPLVNFGRDASVNMPLPDMGLPQDMAVMPPVERRNRLVVQGNPDVSLFRGERLELSVRYLDADGTPIANQPVTLGPVNMAEALVAISARQVQTDNNGMATFTIVAQNTDGRARYQAEAENADPAFWMVRVAQKTDGEVAVNVTYDLTTGRYLLENIDRVSVKLIQGNCQTAFTAQPGRRTFNGPDVTPFDGDDISVVNGVPVTLEFAAVAFGRNTLNRNIVQGCNDGHRAIGGERLEIDLPLLDQPLEFKGIFEVEHHINLIQLVEGGGDEDLNTFVDILEVLGALGGANQEGEFPRGNAMLQLLCDRADIGQPWCGLLRTFGAGPLEQWINDQADENPDVAEALDILDILGDVFTNLTDLTIEGEMEFIASYPDNEGYLRDNQSRWQRMRFQWRNNCPFARPEECTRSFDLARENMGRDTPIQAGFDAILTDSDTLLISRHQLGLNYGLFVLLALEEWILPLLTDLPAPVPLEALFAQLIDCNQLDADLGLPAGTCADVVLPAVSILLRDQLLQINDGTDLLTLEGQVEIADQYPNLKVDTLKDGVWNGYFGEVADEEGEVDLLDGIGTFEGCRDTECMLLPEAMEEMDAEMNANP